MASDSAVPASVCDHITEVIICCREDGVVTYANRAAVDWSGGPCVGEAFVDLPVSESSPRAAAMLEEAARSAIGRRTHVWEFAARGEGSPRVAAFQAYRDEGCVVLIGQLRDTRTGGVVEEMARLTAELAEAQRQEQRQNRALQQALEERDRLLATVRDLTAPAVPVWEGVLLLPIVGHIDQRRAELIREQLLERVSAAQARIVIVDLSGIAAVDETVTTALLKTIQALRLLGARAVLVGISPTIALTMIGMGVDFGDLSVCADLESGIRYALGEPSRDRRDQEVATNDQPTAPRRLSQLR
jgi:anti-anti-sigma regulatory factor